MNKNERKEFAKIAASFGESPLRRLVKRLAVELEAATARGREEMRGYPQATDLNRFYLPSER
jgi:hypothetical protein